MDTELNDTTIEKKLNYNVSNDRCLPVLLRQRDLPPMNLSRVIVERRGGEFIYVVI